MAIPEPEYIKVRKYLYNLAQHAKGAEIKIPSENELCRIFNVSRITVRGAIRGLVEQRILVSRRGVGTFVSSNVHKQSSFSLPVVGIFSGDGQQVLTHERISVAAVGQCAMAAETLQLPDANSPERLVEILHNSVDAVIWESPYNVEPYLAVLAESGKPLLLVNGTWKESDSIAISRAVCGQLLAEHLYRHGHRELFYLHNYSGKGSVNDDPDLPETTSGAFYGRMRELSGCDGRDKFMTVAEFAHRISRKMTPERHAVLYSSFSLAGSIVRALAEVGLAVPRDLSYIGYRKASPFFFGGLTPAVLDDCSAIEESIVEWLHLRLVRREKYPYQRQLTPQIINNDTFLINYQPQE